jgi:hypothetical protein
MQCLSLDRVLSQRQHRLTQARIIWQVAWTLGAEVLVMNVIATMTVVIAPTTGTTALMSEIPIDLILDMMTSETDVIIVSNAIIASKIATEIVDLVEMNDVIEASAILHLNEKQKKKEFPFKF